MLNKESKNIRFIINRIVSANNNLKYMSCLSRNFHALPSPLDSRRKLTSIVNGFVRVDNGIGFALKLRGCSDAHKTFALKHQLAHEIDVRLGNELNEHGACQRGKPLVFNQVSRVESFVVAVDVDEVLGNFVSALNRFIADRYSMNHTVSEYHVYEFFKIWNCSRDEADIRVHEFFKTSYFKNGIHPIPGALEALNNLSKLCKLSVVTSRQNVIKDHTVEWIEKHYPGLFREIHFGNHFALDGVSRPKSEICRALEAKVLIDDNPRYAIECAEAGIRVLLFDYENSYPWSKMDSVGRHPLITKVCNWDQVEQQLMRWIGSRC